MNEARRVKSVVDEAKTMSIASTLLKDGDERGVMRTGRNGFVAH